MITFGRARYADIHHLARVKGWTEAEARRQVALERSKQPKPRRVEVTTQNATQPHDIHGKRGGQAHDRSPPEPTPSQQSDINMLMRESGYSRETATAMVMGPRVKFKAPERARIAKVGS